MDNQNTESNRENDDDIDTRKKRQAITRNTVECLINQQGKNLSFKDMSSLLNLSKSTIKRLCNKYLNGEFLDLSNFKTAGEKKSLKQKDISFEKSILASEIASNPCTSLKSMSYALSTYNVTGSYSPSTISRILKKMNYTRKTLTLVPINRNSNTNKTLRAEYGADLNMLADDRLIFLDESGFNLHLHQKMGYSPKNTKCFINVPNSKGVNISLLCAITISGVLAYKIKIGSLQSSDLLEFIASELPQLENNNRKYIIMDNASIHKTSEVREALNRKNYILKFLPPYSPQLNPIEEFFACLKSIVRQRPISTHAQMLIDVINEILTNDEFRMIGYFEHMRKWVEKSIVHADFI